MKIKVTKFNEALLVLCAIIANCKNCGNMNLSPIASNFRLLTVSLMWICQRQRVQVVSSLTHHFHLEVMHEWSQNQAISGLFFNYFSNNLWVKFLEGIFVPWNFSLWMWKYRVVVTLMFNTEHGNPCDICSEKSDYDCTKYGRGILQIETLSD